MEDEAKERERTYHARKTQGPELPQDCYLEHATGSYQAASPRHGMSARRPYIFTWRYWSDAVRTLCKWVSMTKMVLTVWTASRVMSTANAIYFHSVGIWCSAIKLNFKEKGVEINPQPFI